MQPWLKMSDYDVADGAEFIMCPVSSADHARESKEAQLRHIQSLERGLADREALLLAREQAEQLQKQAAATIQDQSNSKLALQDAQLQQLRHELQIASEREALQAT